MRTSRPSATTMPTSGKAGSAPAGGVRFQTRSEVDFVVVGSGAAGGVLAKELSSAGFSVVVLEQGPYLRPGDFRHDEVGGFFNFDLLPKPNEFPSTFRQTEQDEATVQAFPPSPETSYYFDVPVEGRLRLLTRIGDYEVYKRE
ncbi:MAG: GMC family oxidoreductase [Gemmatimonadetes bacterium]|nr:GMC family oxidoreductase [Gemmatimonadota bacterium]